MNDRTVIPIVAVGPGTQPDDETLNYLPMPGAMATYSRPQLPEPEDVAGLEKAWALLDRLLQALDAWRSSDSETTFPLCALGDEDLEFVDQVLGEGEVSILLRCAEGNIRVQESVLAGVWRTQETDLAGALRSQSIEIGPVPEALKREAFQGAAATPASLPDPLPEGLMNAPSILAELAAEAATYRPGAPAHVVNLSLLPHTEADLSLLDRQLGTGRAEILSRGYGNCRISATATRNVWWVRFFNSRDLLILNTLEVVDVPQVACAAPEDLEDSAQRLREILEVYR